MEDLTTRAQLVDGSEVGAQSITATVPRREIEDTLAGDDGPADLILDVAGGGASGETRRIAVEWERDDLERLLRQADGESVLFTFDRRALAQAFEDADVESHGLREKALILTVAAATAAGAAGAAKAVPDMGEGVASSPGVAAYTAIEDARTGGTAAQGVTAGASAIEAARSADQAPQQATSSEYSSIEAARATDQAFAATADASGASAIEAARATGQADEGIPASYGEAVADFRAAEAVPETLAAGYAGVDTVGDAVAAEFATSGAAEMSGLEAARSTQPGSPGSGATDGGSFAVETPSPAQTAALAGAAALAITGAAFMARSRRRLTPSG
jgi:hypothetical protein